MALTSADRLMAPAVATSLASLDLADEDSAAAKLAERYATELDQAAAIATHADRVLRLATETGDEDLIEQVQALRNRLTARTALENLGPKLEVLLNDLGATPMARAKLIKLSPPAQAAPTDTSWLGAMRGPHSA